MSIVTPNNAAEGRKADLRNAESNDPRARGDKRGMTAYSGFDFGEQALLNDKRFSDPSDSSNASAHRHGFQSASKAHDDRSTESSAVLLASAQGSLVVGPMGFTPFASFPPTQPPTRADHATELVGRIEQALRASLHIGGPEPLSLRVGLDDLQIPGLKSLHISMTTHSLDVDFARKTASVDPDLIAAAQGLAQLLAVRFPTRVVRILTTNVDDDVARDPIRYGSGLRKFTAFLADRSDGS